MAPASPPNAKPSGRLISLPVFWQVLGLSLVVLVLAVGINTLIVLKAPDPPPSGYSIAEAAAALKGGEIRLHNGRTLKVAIQPAAPDFARADWPQHRMETMITAGLATALGVPQDRLVVRVAQMRGFKRPMGGDHIVDERIETHVIVMQRQPGGDAFQASGQSPPPPGPPEWQERDPLPPPQMVERSQLPDDLGLPPFSVAWKQVDGTYRVLTPPATWIQPWQARLLMGFGLTAVLILPLAWLLSQNLSRPIIAFSDAAARIGVEDGAPPVLAVGPREVRQAADVLNAMQARIRKQVESRTALMGAIAHDLKTPLARMRLRIEDLPSPLRDKLGQDIAHMDGLIKSAMSFTSAHRLGETLRPLDLSSLVEVVHDDLSAVCDLEPPLIEADIMVRGDAVALKRIVTNLVENACRYAGGGRISLSRRGAQAELLVSDNGPGLPPGELEAVFEPFYRVESSRNRDTGGAGLGLSVARALAEAQGGSLTLANRHEGAKITGCEARLVLPCLKS